MLIKKYLIILLGGLIAVLESGSARANAPQVIEKERFTCDWATARQEQAFAIPRGLLKAISLAETGRWHPGDEESFAWPWTVTSGGPGKYFPSKAQAIREVRRLQAKGVTNIDVGCMQINLHFHGEHFENLAEAFDPDANAAYAATFIKRLFKRTQSWEQAAGRYHSGTPERLKSYLAKVERLWDKHLARSGEAADGLNYAALGETIIQSDIEFGAATAPGNGLIPDISKAFQTGSKPVTRLSAPDPVRTAKLNRRLDVPDQALTPPAGQEDLSQVGLLRAGVNRAIPFGTAASMNRARQVALAKRDLRARMVAAKQDRFAKRRVAQLRNWRLKRATQ